MPRNLRQFEGIKKVVCPATREEPRKVEAAILPFQDGRLYLVYTAGERADYQEGKMPEGKIRLMGRWSRDSGESWSDPFTVRQYAGIPNAMEPSFLRLPSGRVLQVYMQRDTYRADGDPFGEMYPMITRSDDQCRTWSEPESVTAKERIYFTTNDRLLSLSTGRILLPVLVAPQGNTVGAWISDDGGENWRRGKTFIRTGEGVRFGYPVATELADGRLAMFLMNSTGSIQVARSTDQGDSWSEACESGPAPCPATLMVRRVPESPDLLLIWNNHTYRANLTAALSRDHGRSWANFGLLEKQDGWPVNCTYAFPSLAFNNDLAHLTWYRRRPDPESGARFDLIYRRLPISWFYDQVDP